MAGTAEVAAQNTAPRRGRGPGFPKGVSGNPGGRPKGVPTFNVKQIMGRVLVGNMPAVERAVLEALKSEAQTFRGLELAAKLNKELVAEPIGAIPANAIQFNLHVGASSMVPALPDGPPTEALTLSFVSLPRNGNGHGNGHGA